MTGAAEDALTDQLQEEYWDGSLKIDEEKVQNRFFEQTAYVLDLTGETEKGKLKGTCSFAKTGK